MALPALMRILPRHNGITFGGADTSPAAFGAIYHPGFRFEGHIKSGRDVNSTEYVHDTCRAASPIHYKLAADAYLADVMGGQGATSPGHGCCSGCAIFRDFLTNDRRVCQKQTSVYSFFAVFISSISAVL
jgi:hypothetical protein